MSALHQSKAIGICVFRLARTIRLLAAGILILAAPKALAQNVGEVATIDSSGAIQVNGETIAVQGAPGGNFRVSNGAVENGIVTVDGENVTMQPATAPAGQSFAADSRSTGTLTINSPAPQPGPPGASFDSDQVQEAANLRFNFQGVSLSTVLDYIGRTAGLVIVKEADVTGRIDMVSHEDLTPDQAVDLLNTVLYSRGYAALRNGNTLTVFDLGLAGRHNLPVRVGSDPATIPQNDTMVTQIIPVRYTSAKSLLENLQPLLPNSIMNANESSNAVVMTDTQKNIHRMAEIIKGLDQSISEITTVHVYPLQFADSKTTADLITNIYKAKTGGTGDGNFNPRQFFSRFGGGGRGGGGGDDGGGGGTGTSVAMQAATSVTAVSDDRTNSVIVSAPDELLPTITQLVESIDTETSVLNDVRVFPLRYSNCTDMATVVSGIFGEASKTSQNAQNGVSRFRGRNGGGGGGGFGGFGGGGGGGGQGGQAGNTASARQQTLNTVLIVPDTRTNSLIVSATTGAMEQISEVIQSLDRDPAKTKKVYTFKVKDGNPQQIADTVNQMFGNGTSTTSGAGTTGATATNDNTNNIRGNNNRAGGNNGGGGGGGGGGFGGGGGGGGFGN